jgi:hypothetical protein
MNKWLQQNGIELLVGITGISTLSYISIVMILYTFYPDLFQAFRHLLGGV